MLPDWQSDVFYFSFYLVKFVAAQNKLIKYGVKIKFKASQDTFKSWLIFLGNN